MIQNRRARKPRWLLDAAQFGPVQSAGVSAECSLLGSVLWARAIVFWVLKFIRRTSPRPIHIVMADPNQNQIGESVARQQLSDLPGEIASAKDFAEKNLLIFPV